MSAWGGLLGGSGHPQWLPSVNADGSVAGCSPQFWVAQLRSQISRSCNLLLTHWICACTLAPNERPGKALSYNVQTDSQKANAHLPAQYLTQNAWAESPSRKMFLKVRFLLDGNGVMSGHYVARYVRSMRTEQDSGSRLPHRYPSIRIWLHDSQRYGIFIAGLLWTLRELRAKWLAMNARTKRWKLR
jgi:hypothetical protein